MNNYEKDDVEIVWDILEEDKELKDYLYSFYWNDWRPEHYIDKREVSEQAPEEMVQHLLETGRLEVIGNKVRVNK